MDVLSDAISAMRTGRPYCALTETGTSWEMAFPASTSARFHAVTAGACDVVRHDAPTVTLRPGEAVLFPHGTAHTLRNSVNSRSEVVCGAYQVDQARKHPLFRDLPDAVHLAGGADRHPGLYASVRLLRDELAVAAPGQDTVLPALLDVLLVHLVRAWFTDRIGQQSTGWCVALGDGAVASALRVMHDRPGDPWTVQSLGAHAGLSRAAFARRFATLVGTPPLAYLTWWRLTTAARLLHTTNAPLSAIAQRSGYGSPYAFASAFKREYGMSAGRYRTQRRDKTPDIREPAPAPDDAPELQASS